MAFNQVYNYIFGKKTIVNKIIISDDEHIETFIKWYNTQLLNLNFKITPNMSIDLIYHLLLFIINNGEICYFTDIKESAKMQSKIIECKSNQNIYTKFMMLLCTEDIMKPIPIQIIEKLLSYMKNEYKSILALETFTRDGKLVDDIGNQIIVKIKKVINDNNIIDKQLQITQLELNYKLIENLKLNKNRSYKIIKHNYKTIISALEKNEAYMNSFPDIMTDDFTFMPMEIASSKKD
jgi:hypothetical protein